MLTLHHNIEINEHTSWLQNSLSIAIVNLCFMAIFDPSVQGKSVVISTYMNENKIFIQNIKFHHEIKTIVEKCSEQKIKVVLVKGSALIEMFPEYSFDREMEDIDIWVMPKDFERFRTVLKSLGYEDRPEDPNAMVKYKSQQTSQRLDHDYREVGEVEVCVDITQELWYYSKKKNVEIFNSAEHLSKYGSDLDCYVLPPEEMIKNIYMHALLHGNCELKWEKDIQLIKRKSLTTDYELRINKITKYLINKNIYYKGHVIKFLLSPFDQKIFFLFNLFFPLPEFLIRRYNSTNILFGYLKRYVLILLNSFYVCIHLCKSELKD